MRNHLTRATLLTIALSLALSPLAAAQGSGDDAVIVVVFTEDDMGFTATSTKDISNIIVEFCDGSWHKHDGLDGLVYVHNESEVIAAVYVKSGSNNAEGPPGSGEKFENEGVDCDGVPPCVDDPQTEQDECDETEPPCRDDPETEIDECDETEIPFFPGFTALALGSLGALAVVGMMWRRRS